MMEKNKKLNIHEEIHRADQAMEAARLLYENGYFNDAISRLYYCIFYHVRALLLSKGLEPKTHEGALRLLSLHFVKQDILAPQASHIFTKLMKFREEADYNPSYVFTKDDFIHFQKEVQALSEKISEYLTQEGYL